MLEKISDELRLTELVISPSGLIELNKSPKHYYSAYVLKEKEQTEAMLEGELVHKLILEPDKFHEKFNVLNDKEEYICTVDELKEAIVANGEKPVKGNKGDLVNQLMNIDPNAMIWEVYHEEQMITGKKLVDAKTYVRLMRICEEVKANSFLKQALTGGMIEQSAHYKHPLGVYINMRMDFYHPGMGVNKRPVVIDVKKVRSADPDSFSKMMYSSGLYIQAACYVDAITAITGVEPIFAWACVEPEPPFAVEVYACDHGALELGRAKVNQLLHRFIECKNKQEWPSYTQGKIINLSVPHWAFSKENYDIEKEIGAEV